MSDPQPDDAAWSVWRQDDNGNQFLVESGLDQESAQELMETYEKRAHKQVYWISQSPPPPDVPGGTGGESAT